MSVEVASVFRLRIGIAQTSTGWSVLEDDLFTPLLPVAIKLKADSGPSQTLINGFVNSQNVTYSDDPGKSVLEVTGMDATILMNLEEKITAWPNQADSAIASTIFGNYQLAPQVEQTSPVISDPEGTTIQRGSDIRFLRQLAHRNGFDCYVQPDPSSGVDSGYFQSRRLQGQPQSVLSVAAGRQSNVTEVTVRYEMSQPTGAAASGVDVPTKSAQPVTSTSSSDQALGAIAVLDRLKPSPLVRLAGTGLVHSGDLQSIAQAVVNRSSWAVNATGTAGSDVSVLRPGGQFLLRNAGGQLSGAYYLVNVSHHISKDGWVQRFQAVRNAVGLTGAEAFGVGAA